MSCPGVSRPRNTHRQPLAQPKTGENGHGMAVHFGARKSFGFSPAAMERPTGACMRQFLAPAIVVATLIIPAACAKQPAAATAPKLVTDDDKTFYALGVLMSRNLEAFSLTPQEM